MKEVNKLVIGQPYTISVKDNNTSIKISGNELTEDDAKRFIAYGFINKDDIVYPEKKKVEDKLPEFVVIERLINNSFQGIPDFCRKFYHEYPTIAFSMFLREYSRYFRGMCPIKRDNPVYIVNISDFSVVEIKNPTQKELSLSCFADKDIAEKCVNIILRGLYDYAK